MEAERKLERLGVYECPFYHSTDGDEGGWELNGRGGFLLLLVGSIVVEVGR